MKSKYKILFSFLFFISFVTLLKAEETIIELETNKSIIDIENEAMSATDGVILKYGDISIRSDSLKKIEGKNILFSYGNVVFNQGNQVIEAEQVVFDMDTRQAKIINSESFDTELQLRFGGEETFSEYPKKITIKNGWFTPSPYEKPNYQINADEIEIYPNRKLVAKKIAVNIKGKDYIKLPYYVTSLRPANRRATLFPMIGTDSDRGFYGIWGFDYDKGNLAQGFMDVELSAKQKVALKLANDYKFTENNGGSIEVERLVIPIGNNNTEWNFTLNHDITTIPKKEKVDRKFFDLGYGNWNFNYKNMTTNLMRAADRVKLKDDYTDYVNRYKKIAFYDVTINQEIGKNGEFNFNYFWTQDRKALRDLTEINDYIVDRDELDPRRTDVELYRSLKYTNGNSDMLINIDTEDFLDINPGYIGDINSYRKKQNYSIDFKGPKIKLEYIDSDKDEYAELFGMKDRDDADNMTFEKKNIRWVKTTEYDKKRETTLTFGKYYPFRKNDFFGYQPKTTSENLLNNLNFGFIAKKTDIRKKEYEYDFSRDNIAYNNFFLTPNTGVNNEYYNDDRVYKIYENTDIARRAKKIIYEQYDSGKLNIGNDRIDLPLSGSYIGFNYGFEQRDYSKSYVPEFENGRKVEDDTKTGYKILKDINGSEITQKPKVIINTLDTKLFTTLFDNTSLNDNKFDLKITNEADLTIQKTNAKNAMYNGYDIIETPTNALGLRNDFNVYLGNVRFNYMFTGRDDNHFQDNWLKNRYIRNYFKVDIDNNKRFLSADFETNHEYEFENFKTEKKLNREFQYGYVSQKDNNFLYKYTDKNREYYPYNTSLGWVQDEYKEKISERTFSVNFNEWGLDYTNTKSTANDIYGNNPTFGNPELKLKTEFHKIGFVYDTSKKKNKKFESDHYFRVSVGTGKKMYRDINSTPTNIADDFYRSGRDYTTIGVMYRYENNAKPKYKEEKAETKELASVNSISLNPNIETIKQSNIQDFSIEDSTKQSILENIHLTGEDRIFTTSQEEAVYNSYVDAELNKPNKFNLNNFNDTVAARRGYKKYFQIGFDMELDESTSEGNKSGGLATINDFIFKVEAGYLEKFMASYRFIMERPDRRYRNSILRQSQYNYRRHDLELKYAFGKDPDKPWWIGTKLQYIQDGAPKASDPEVYESSSAARKVNKLTLGMLTLSHRFENVEWEIGGGMKWDKPSSKKLGYYPVVSLKFSLTPFPNKSVQMGYDEGRPKFGVGL